MKLKLPLGFEIYAIVVDKIEMPYVALVLERHYECDQSVKLVEADIAKPC